MAGTPADLLAALKAFIAGHEDPTETPEPVGTGENPAAEPDAAELDNGAAEAPADTVPAGGVADAGTEQLADSAAPGDGATGEPAGGNTLPDAPTPMTDAERDAANVIAAENEALRAENQSLRDRVKELGGDNTLGIAEEQPTGLPTADEGDEYDADADIAAQQAHLAELTGGTPDDTDDDDDDDDDK